MVKSRKMRWSGHAARKRGKRITYRVLLRKPEWMRPLRRPSRRGGINTEVVFKETGLDIVDWIYLFQERE
jgi:hypothetical protein